jgi:hypothetical protein
LGYFKLNQKTQKYLEEPVIYKSIQITNKAQNQLHVEVLYQDNTVAEWDMGDLFDTTSHMLSSIAKLLWSTELFATLVAKNHLTE